MNVHSLCADLAMNMKEERVIKPALNAKQDTSALKVVVEWMGMKKRMTPMIWRMSLILMTEKTLTTLPRSYFRLALILAVVPKHMFQGSLHLQRWILFLLIKRSLSSPMAIRMLEFLLISMLL